MAARHAATARGSATVEFALGMPAVVLVLALAVSCTSWATDAARAQHAASEGARAAIVGTDAAALGVARHAAGLATGHPGAVLARDGTFVTVCVAVPARMPMPQGQRCATSRDAP